MNKKDFYDYYDEEYYKGEAIRQAYRTGKYTDVYGVVWKKGLDGWICEHEDGIHISPFDQFTALIAAEWRMQHEHEDSGS